jgi:D-sedoheptulose 7-phosphate isomerase
MLEQRIQQQFFDAADLNYRSAESLARPIAEASQAIVGVLTAGGKLLVCGIGSAAALASLCAAQLMGRFERERPGLAVIALGGRRGGGEPAVEWRRRVGAARAAGVNARLAG